jgi:hypothetical protein
MTSAFQEFSRTYEEFQERFAQHPLSEELRNRMSRGKFPNDEWLRARTKRMKDLMVPVWLRSKSES